eukprot:2466709-Alexandrium_andersonii.AAC.1
MTENAGKLSSPRASRDCALSGFSSRDLGPSDPRHRPPRPLLIPPDIHLGGGGLPGRVRVLRGVRKGEGCGAHLR